LRRERTGQQQKRGSHEQRDNRHSATAVRVKWVGHKLLLQDRKLVSDG